MSNATAIAADLAPSTLYRSDEGDYVFLGADGEPMLAMTSASGHVFISDLGDGDIPRGSDSLTVIQSAVGAFTDAIVETMIAADANVYA